MNRWRRLVLPVLVVATAFPAEPAVAFETRAGVFEGQAYTGPMGFPCAPVGSFDCLSEIPTLEMKTGAAGVSWLNLHDFGNTVGFGFATNICAKVALGPDLFPASVWCTVNATGIAEGYCGLQSGLGFVTVTDLDKRSVTLRFKFIDVGGAVAATGQSDSGSTTLWMLMQKIPPTPLSNGERCLDKTATVWSSVGSFAVLDASI